MRLLNCCGMQLRVSLLASRGRSAQPLFSSATAQWRLLPLSTADAPVDAIEVHHGGGSEAGGAEVGDVDEGVPVYFVAFALLGSRVISQLRLGHDGAHALQLRSSTAAPLGSSPRSSARSSSGAAPSAVVYPLVCEVRTEADGVATVTVRSALRLQNKCASSVEMACVLHPPPPPVTSRRASGASGHDVGAGLHQMLDESAVGPEETLQRTLAPGETAELPVWAMERHASLSLRRSGAACWEVAVCPISPHTTAAVGGADGYEPAAATRAGKAGKRGGVRGPRGSWQAAREQRGASVASEGGEGSGGGRARASTLAHSASWWRAVCASLTSRPPWSR